VVDGASFLAEGDLVRIGQENEPNQPLAKVNPAQAAIKTGASK
jgi:hypothetical protein